MSRTGIIHNPHTPLKGLTLRANLRPFRKGCTTVSQEDFKVTDRRHRGEPSSDASSSRANVPVDHRSERSGSDVGQADLGSLFMMFASSALASLGVAPDPQTKQSPRDLAQARATIDVLLMLREKTNGNRTEQENRLVEGILYDLQMRFVSAVREAPEAPKSS